MPFGSSELVTGLFCNAHPLALVLPVSCAINNQQLWAVLAWICPKSLSSRQKVSGPHRPSRSTQGWKCCDLAGFENCVSLTKTATLLMGGPVFIQGSGASALIHLPPGHLWPGFL
ncbi:unnamed protein product [Rangifer tarandus platyrhynchus]|uniref:Uncharacterized protein n=1 Tax=Rangifer tarandus platyrhynchus TaxID=3082113 RepID=A0ABN8YK16_RANTA|nr:unnamed protein product [Rangifer tarandus platyrhynchus]